MRTILALFKTYDEAQAAVQELMKQDIHPSAVNVIVQEQVAKNYTDVYQKQIKIQKADPEEVQKLYGLDTILGGQQALHLPDVGSIYAAGETVTILAKTAIQGTGGGLQGALHSFAVPEEQAEGYAEGIRGGGVLLWVRADDDRAADTARLLRDQKGTRVASFNG